MSKFIVMRGLPGSGKSWLAKQLVEDGEIFSADDYFNQEGQDYAWEGWKVPLAHKWNHQRISEAIDNNVTPIVVDNTNVSLKDLRSLAPMIRQAQEKGYTVELREPQTDWKFNVDELVKRCSHGVVKKSMERFLRRWVKDVTIEQILTEN